MACSIDIPSASRASVWRRRLLTATAAAALPAVAGVLYTYPPADYSFYPPCYFHALTGCHCPGCGGTRCLHALLHGDLAQAAAYNVVALLSLPLVALWALNLGWLGLTGHPAFRWPDFWYRPKLILFLVVLFWILRNLPFEPFVYLAPHKL